MHAKNTEYVIFDVETTGLSPLRGDRIVEIGAVKYKNGEICETFESMVNPQRLIPLEAQQINKITQEMVDAAPLSEEVLPKMIDFIGGACLVGHNIKFDLDFLCYELSLLGRRLQDVTPAIDTLKMARKLLPHYRSFRLSYLAESYGMKADGAHRALFDVELTARLLSRLLELAATQGMGSFKEVYKHFGVQKPSFKIEAVTQELLF